MILFDLDSIIPQSSGSALVLTEHIHLLGVPVIPEATVGNL